MAAIPPFVLAIENSAPSFDDYVRRVLEMNPDLPANQLPPIWALQPIITQWHEERVREIRRGGYLAYRRTSFCLGYAIHCVSGELFRNGNEANEMYDLAYARAVQLMPFFRARIDQDIEQAIVREVRRFEIDLLVAQTLCEDTNDELTDDMESVYTNESTAVSESLDSNDTISDVD